MEERQKVAREFAAQFKLSLPILVDTLDDQAEKAFAAWPDRIYVLDAEGRIAYKGGPGPRGFSVPEAEAVLAKLLGEPVPPPPLPALPPMLRERLTAMLERAGLEPPEKEAALRAVARKLEGYRPAMEARRALFAAGEDPAANEKALAAYTEAGRKYLEAAAKIDEELKHSLDLRRQSPVLARLTAMGLYGAHTTPPFGMAGPGPR